MSIKSNAAIHMHLRRGDEVSQEIGERVLPPLIEGAQLVVAEAVRNHPYQTQTGTNDRSLGWCASPWGERNFGSVTTGAGATASSGAGFSKADRPTVLVASTSGYGGFLEVGTSKMRAYPYLGPALTRLRKEILQKLKKAI